MSIAIATTILEPPPFLPSWLDYHLRRVQHVIIYMDDPHSRPTFEQICGERPVELLDGAQNHSEMSPESRTILRQCVNIQHAIKLLAERKCTWLLHIDVDELLYEPSADVRGWNLRPELGCVFFRNHEALPLEHEPANPFHDCVWFGINGKRNFMAYGNGKSAARIGPNLKPSGPHAFTGFQGERLTPAGDEVMILHYPTPSFNSWVAKFTQYGRFSDNWYDNPCQPNKVTFMLRSRDLVLDAVATGDWSKAKAFYAEQIPDEDVINAGVVAGKIRRYEPFGGVEVRGV